MDRQRPGIANKRLQIIVSSHLLSSLRALNWSCLLRWRDLKTEAYLMRQAPRERRNHQMFNNKMNVTTKRNGSIWGCGEVCLTCGGSPCWLFRVYSLTVRFLSVRDRRGHPTCLGCRLIGDRLNKGWRFCLKKGVTVYFSSTKATKINPVLLLAT